jgi:PadR family transcriptional regulator PadR
MDRATVFELAGEHERERVKLARDEERQHDGLAGLRESLPGPVRRREFELWIHRDGNAAALVAIDVELSADRSRPDAGLVTRSGLIGGGKPQRCQIDSRPAQLASWRLTCEISSCRLRILSMGRKAHKNDSLPGSLDMLILRTLSLRDLHGYGIAQFIQQSSANELLVEEGSLYPALQRLELNGWIDGKWGVTSTNRRARIYKITATGRKQLAVETRKYATLTLAIARVMSAK